jgi:hypothetical protein
MVHATGGGTAMNVHPKWGRKFVCFKCGCKFYDLSKSPAVCPKCGADQADVNKEELLEEEELVDGGAEVDDDADTDSENNGVEDDLPPMQEELGYDETDEEE